MGITLDLREAIHARVEGKSKEELIDIVNDSIHQDEQALPGLGVFLEMIWTNSDAKLKSQMAECLHEGFKQKA